MNTTYCPALIVCWGEYEDKERELRGKVDFKRHTGIEVRDIPYRKDVDLLMAVVGTVDLRLPHATHLLESSYVHEKYNRSDSWINDIALIKVTLISRK